MKQNSLFKQKIKQIQKLESLVGYLEFSNAKDSIAQHSKLAKQIKK